MIKNKLGDKEKKEKKSVIKNKLEENSEHKKDKIENKQANKRKSKGDNYVKQPKIQKFFSQLIE